MIKNLKKVAALALVIAVMLITLNGCKKSAFDINVNPNAPTDNSVSYNVILPAALNNTGNVITTQWGFLQSYLSFWARSGTYAANTDEESYNVTPNSAPAGSIWSSLYDNLFDYNTMEAKATAAGADFYAGVGKIMKAHNYALLVDLYGNVPYKEALKGSALITPKYDNGLDIYKDLFRQVDAGIAQIAGASNSTTGPNKFIVNDDIMFSTPTAAISSSNIDALKIKWAQFGNTIKLRMLVHLMNGGIATPTTTAAGINIANEFSIIAANGKGYLTTNAEVNPGYKSDRPNPFYNTYVKDVAGTATGNSVYYKANSVGLTLYSDNGDPRINLFYKAGANGMVGVKYGLPPVTANAAANLAGIGDGVSRGADKPVWILTAAECYLLQAEAINRGFIPGGAAGAKTAMTQGVYESFLALGSTVAAANTYFTNNLGYPDVDYNSNAVNTGQVGGLYTIISQKWLALNAIAPFEVWTDYRRVDFNGATKHFVYGGTPGGHPAGVVPQISVYSGNTKTEIPSRMPFPQTEYNYNPTNVAAQGTVNIFTNKIFWDLN